MINELKDAFSSLKINKRSGVNGDQLSLEKGVFPDYLTIAKVTPIYKAGDNSDISLTMLSPN